MEAHLHEEFKLWSFVVLCQSQSRMQGGKREKSNMKNSRGKQLLDTFLVLPGVHFMHTISRFKAWEFRSPTLQTVCELELKRRSYGRLKTTASSCAKFRSCKMSCENFATQSPFPSYKTSCEMKSTYKILQGVLQLWNHLQAHVCRFASWNSIFVVANHVAKSPPSYESSCKSSPSCGITSKLWKHKFNLQNQSSNLQNG